VPKNNNVKNANFSSASYLLGKYLEGDATGRENLKTAGKAKAE